MKKEKDLKIVKPEKGTKPKKITNKEASEALKKNNKKAEELLQNEDKMDKFLEKLEKKLKVIPKLGDKLAIIPTFISLIKSYIKKEYKEIPIGTIVAILSALIYFLSPIDLIPDVAGPLGYVDDAAVILACLKLVESDVNDYIEWKEQKRNKQKDVEC